MASSVQSQHFVKSDDRPRGFGSWSGEEREAYERYVKWCRSLRLKVADFATWVRTSRSVSDHWNELKVNSYVGLPLHFRRGVSE